MIKAIIKELFIGIGLCLIIALLAAIMFYSYIPANKAVPTVEAYERTDALEEQLKVSTELNDTKTVVTYDIGISELSGYEKTGQLDTGNPNPFSATPTGNASGNNSENNTGNSTNNNSTGNNTNNNPGYSKDPNAK